MKTPSPYPGIADEQWQEACEDYDELAEEWHDAPAHAGTRQTPAPAGWAGTENLQQWS